MIELGLSAQEFRAACFEREARLFRGALTERPMAWPDVDAVLHAMEPGAPAMRLFHQGLVPEHAYTDESVELGKARRRLNKAKFYALLGNGATLVLNRLEEHCVAAKRLCIEVGRFSGAQTSGNAYLSFNGSGTFGKHWDTHDVFAIQLIGRKRWQVFEPTLPLPLTYQTSDRSGHVCPAEPAIECTLEAGDVLYVPRGWWHQAIPLDVGSFHFSVGAYAPTVYDYVMWTAVRYLQQNAGARRAFSPADYRDALAEAVRDLPAVLLDPAHAAEFERDSIGRERPLGELNLGLLDPAAAPLPDAAVLRLTSCHTPSLERGEVTVNGHRVRLDGVSLAVVAALRDAVALRLGELCARRSDLSAEAVRRAVVELACHDVVTIEAHAEPLPAPRPAV